MPSENSETHMTVEQKEDKWQKEDTGRGRLSACVLGASDVQAGNTSQSAEVEKRPGGGVG